MTRYLVTGAAGFIGFHLARLATGRGRGRPRLRRDDRLLRRQPETAAERDPGGLPELQLHRGDARGQPATGDRPDEFRPDVIVHLAAQAGVRYSLENPRAYVESNVVGTFNVMEAAKSHKVRHLLMASTSSVYGANHEMPFAETDKADTQLTIYAATKKANESMAHSYAHLWDLPTTMFRFFTVYGPWGRPDLAYYKFVDAILDGRPIDVYNHGDMYRDFTHVGDLVRGSAPGRRGTPRDSGPGGDTRLRQPVPGRAVPGREHRKLRQGKTARLHRRDRGRAWDTGDP